MKYLTMNEEVLLIAIRRLKTNAYPVTIREEFIKISKKTIVYGALYNSLDYLVKKGYVESRKGEPTPEQGGKRKVFFSITPEGMVALRRTMDFQKSLLDGAGEIALGSE